MTPGLSAEHRLSHTAERGAHSTGFGRLDQNDPNQKQRYHYDQRIQQNG